MSRPSSREPDTTVSSIQVCSWLISCSAIGSFLFGYDSGIISSVISQNYNQFQNYYKHPTDGPLGAIVSVFAGGAFFGALLAGRTADWFGRKVRSAVVCMPHDIRN